MAGSHLAESTLTQKSAALPLKQMILLLAHIAGMDTFARGLKSAAKLKEDGFFDRLKEERYASFEEGVGKKIVEDQEDLESLTDYALSHDEPTMTSSHIEYVKNLLNDYLV
jgi:xylose isomerase